MDNINETLFQAIDTIITKRLEEVVFDEILQCVVVSRISSNSNEYEVKNNSVIYKAIAKDDEEYRPNDNVCVSVLRNSGEKIILGKYTLSQEDALIYQNPFDKFVIDKALLLIHSDTTEEQPIISLCSQQEGIEPQETIKQIDLTPINNQTTSLQGYDFMGVEFGIRVNLGENNTNGEWAIGITLLDHNNNPLHTMHEYGYKEKMSPYLIASTEVYGNAYTLTPNFAQRKLFHFPNGLQLSKIKKVQLSLYQNGAFNETTQDSILMVENFQLTFGYDVNKYLDAPIHLYVEGEYNNVYSYADAEHIGLNLLPKPNIKALLIDQANKCIIKQLAADQSIRWYQYKINEPGDDYGGGYWKYIEGVNDLILPANKYVLDMDRPNTQIKAVLCEDKSNINFNIDLVESVVFDDKRPLVIDSNTQLLDADKQQYIICHDVEQNTVLATWDTTLNQWTTSEWNWPSDKDWLVKNYSLDTTLFTIVAIINLQENITLRAQEPIKYYQYLGDYMWERIYLGNIEKTVLATSVPFVFERNQDNLDTGDIIQILSDTTHFAYYKNGVLINTTPIKLELAPMSSEWPEEIISLEWTIARSGLISKITADESGEQPANEHKAAQTIYCHLQEHFNQLDSIAGNNIIYCSMNGGKYKAHISLSFSEQATRGTNYSFFIEPSDSEKWLIQNNVNNIEYKFKPRLITNDGIELDTSQLDIEWSWFSNNVYYEDFSKTEQAKYNGSQILFSPSQNTAVTTDDIFSILQVNNINEIENGTMLNNIMPPTDNSLQVQAYCQAVNSIQPDSQLSYIELNSDPSSKEASLVLQKYFSPLRIIKTEPPSVERHAKSETITLQRKTPVVEYAFYSIENQAWQYLNYPIGSDVTYEWPTDIASAFSREEALEIAISLHPNYEDDVQYEIQYTPEITVELCSWHYTPGIDYQCNQHILQAKCRVNALQQSDSNKNVTQEVELIAKYPIIISDYDYVEYHGIYELYWDSFGRLLTDLTDDNNTYEVYFNSPLIPTYDHQWVLYCPDKNYPFYIDSDNRNLVPVQDPPRYRQQQIAAVTCEGFETGHIYLQCPLMLTISQYDINLSNQWSGSSVTIDDKQHTIMATAFGAGIKHPDTNTFSGVLMGAFSDGTTGEIRNGLYGFSHGLNTFGINAADGSAHFEGRISGASELFIGNNVNNYVKIDSKGSLDVRGGNITGAHIMSIGSIANQLDRFYTVNDIDIMRDMILEIRPMTEADIAYYDQNGDGRLTPTDLRILNLKLQGFYASSDLNAATIVIDIDANQRSAPMTIGSYYVSYNSDGSLNLQSTGYQTVLQPNQVTTNTVVCDSAYCSKSLRINQLYFADGMPALSGDYKTGAGQTLTFKEGLLAQVSGTEIVQPQGTNLDFTAEGGLIITHLRIQNGIITEIDCGA